MCVLLSSESLNHGHGCRGLRLPVRGHEIATVSTISKGSCQLLPVDDHVTWNVSFLGDHRRGVTVCSRADSTGAPYECGRSVTATELRLVMQDNN